MNTCPECVPLNSYVSSFLARGYGVAQRDFLRNSWNHPWHRAKSTLRPGKPYLQTGLPGIGLREPRFFTLTINVMRICDVLSVGPNLPNRVHYPYSDGTYFCISSGIDWSFTAISNTTTRNRIKRQDDEVVVCMRVFADDEVLQYSVHNT